MSGLLAYLPHVLYSTALTSVTMHHLHQRKAAESERAHVAAQLSILEDLRTRLSSPPSSSPLSSGSSSSDPPCEPLDDREFDRLWRLARSHDVWLAREAAAAQERAEREGTAAAAVAAAGEPGAHVKSVHVPAGESVGWREVLLGKRFDTARTEELDRKDMARVLRDVEADVGASSGSAGSHSTSR